MLTQGLGHSLPDAVLAVADGGSILAAWGPAGILPADPGALAGQRFDRIFARPRAARALLEVGARETVVRELQLRDLRRVVVTAAPLAGGGGVAVSMRPVAGSRRDETLGLLIREAIASAPGPLDPAHTMAFLAGLVRRVLPGFDCLIAVVPPEDKSVFRVVAGAGPWAERRVGEKWAAGDLEHFETASTRVIPARATAPLPDGRTVLGAVAFHRPSDEPVGDEEQAICEDFAALIAVSLQRVQLRDAAQHTATRLQTALDVAIDLAASLEPRQVVRRLLLRAGDAVGADRGTLIRVDGDELTVEDFFDRRRQALRPSAGGRLSTLPADSLIRVAVETQQPTAGEGHWLPEIPGLIQEAVADASRRLAFPLVLGREVVAVLMLHRREGPEFGAEELEMLRLFGGAAALALRNAWLFAEADEAGRTKTDFLNMGAHELRTPLTVISGYLSMLREGSLGQPPEGWRHPLDMLAAKTTELSAIVEDLLLASRIETGRLPLRRSRFDLRSAVETAVARVMVVAQTAGGRIESRLPSEPVEVDADPDKVAHIVHALVANAIVYSEPPARVLVAVSGAPAPRVTVEDEGVGVPEAERERIFERFHRLPGPLGHRAGTGLGLYVARELARRHGGDVVVDWSREGEGSRFVLELPPP